LHILVNFEDINEDIVLVKNVDGAKNNWNKEHDILIKG
jgi:hypothetical protein